MIDVKRALILQHTAVDDPGIVQGILDEAPIQCTTVRLDKNEPIPNEVSADLLLSFGGPTALYLDDLPAWVAHEQELMRDYLDQGKRVMGICLGAQMLASALGARTYPNPEREVGWHHICRVDVMAGHAPQEFTVLHWHQNTFDLPVGATRLFRSEACRNQGFAIGDQAIGLQFHPEVTEKTIGYFLAVSGLCRKPSTYVQSREEIEAGIPLHLASQHAWFRDFLVNWLTVADA